MAVKPLVIENFQSGIANSPYVGFADMRNLDVDSEEGVAKLNFLVQRVTPAAKSGITFTANAATDVITTASTLDVDVGSTTGRAVTVSSSGTLPAGLSAGTIYFLIRVTATTYKLATSLTNADAGTAVDITSAGSGTHTISVINHGEPKVLIVDPNVGTKFMLDSNGRVWFDDGTPWRLLPGNTLTNANGNGMGIFKDYLIVARNDKLDVCKINTAANLGDPQGTSAWTNGWQTLNTGSGANNPHPVVIGQDDIAYIGDGRYVVSIAETSSSTFDPATSSTYTFTLSALKLPIRYVVQSMVENGVNLMVGAAKANIKEAQIFPWDRSSTTYRLPIRVPETSITAMLTEGNRTYVAAGTRGVIYVTNGVLLQILRKVPVTLSGVPTNTVSIPAMMYHKNKVYFALNCIGISGIWSLDPLTNSLKLEHIISTGNYGTSSGVRVSALMSYGPEQFYAGWADADAGTFGIDSNYLTNFYYSTWYVGYFISPVYIAGSPRSKRTFTTIEFELDRPLVSGQGVRISYRTNLNSSFTTIGTYDFSTYGAIQSLADTASIVDAEVIQLKCELTVGANSTATPRLKAITLY
jgi:hypothetical protein